MENEAFLSKLLDSCYRQDTVNIYDVGIEHFRNDETGFSQIRMLAHHLVRAKLATYADEEDTLLKITNYGRYWMTRGGYLVYLKEEHELKEKRNHEKEIHQERLLEARLKLTHYRLLGFWVALVISALGLALSVFNLFLFLNNQKN
ncbi:MAG: hypothetical protein MUE71_00625 [Chitinophagaceae bacterium]|jgi:hypothetical protein|nr:hypothetical protein [Chitinophagaceae bacterium]